MCVCIYVLGTCYPVCRVGCRCDVWSSKRTFGFKLDGQVEDGPNNSGGAGVHARSGSVRRSVAFARPPVTKMPPTGATSVRKTAFNGKDKMVRRVWGHSMCIPMGYSMQPSMGSWHT